MKFYAVFTALAAFATLLYFAKPQLREETETFYYFSASSASGRISATEYDGEGFFGAVNYLPVKAESAFTAGECDVEAIFAKYNAKPVKTVVTGDITDYYCYSTLLRGGMILYGKTVNFHLAVGPYGYSVGTPLIYGGY